MSDIKKFIENQAELTPKRVVDLATILRLKNRKEEINTELKIINETIEKLQSLCDHDYSDFWETPHYKIEQCIHCENLRKI